MATAAARSPSPGQARPCCAMRRSADSSPFKPADCPQRSATFSKGGGVCGCHASPRRRSFGEKENDQQRDAAAARTPTKAVRASGSKNFMSPTISATSKAVAASPSPRKRVLGERNEETHLFAPFSPANLAHKPKGGPPSEAGSARRLRSVPAPPPRAPELGSQRLLGEEDARMENHHHHHDAADSVDADPSRAALYDPKTNYTSPRPRFLHYKPNPRIDMYRHGGSATRRLDEGLASESSEESVTTTDDDLTEEEQEQVQQQIPEVPSALAAAPSEAEEAAAVPAAVPCVLPPELALGSPRAPVLISEPAVMSTPVCVLASQPRAASPRTPVVTSEPAVVTSPPALDLAAEPRAASPRARALTPELGVSSARAPAKKRSSLRFIFPLALVLFIAAAAFASVSLPPDSPIMANPAVSKVANFLSVQELHPVELAAWLKEWSSSSLESITSYWEAFASTQEQEYSGPPFSANMSAALADADHGADFYYNFAEAMPGEEPIGARVWEEQLRIRDVVSASDLTALPEVDVVVEEESIDDDAVEEVSDALEYYKVVEELGVEILEEAPGSDGANFLEEQQDVASASNTDLSAQAEGDAVMEEESIDAALPEELDLEISEEAPDNYGEEMTSFSQNLDTPSELIGEPEQDVETDESEEDHTSGKEGEEVYRGLKSDSSMWPSYLDTISKPAAAPGSDGANFLEEQQDVASASNTDLSAQAEGDAVMEEESIDAALPEELDLEISEEAPDNYGEEMTSFSQNLDTPSELIGEPEQDVETDESEEDHTSGKEGEEVYRGLKSDSSMWPSYLDTISKPAAAGVALLVVLLSAGIAVFTMRKNQTQVTSTSSAPVEEPEQAASAPVAEPEQVASAPVGEPEQAEHQSVEDHHLVKPSQSVSGSSQGDLVRPSQFQSSMAEETERFGDSVSQYSSSLSSGQGRRRKTVKEENLSLEPGSRRESTAQSTSSYGSFTTLEKISAKKKNKDDEAMTPVRRSSRLRTAKTPEA